MSSIRLRVDQIEHLRRSDPAKEIHFAVSRWRTGQIVTRFGEKNKTSKNVLQIFSIRRKPEGLTDSQIRDILDEHWRNPIDYSEKLLNLNRIITEYMATMPEYIIEDGNESSLPDWPPCGMHG